MNLDHDTAADIFLAGLAGTWHELLDLPKLAFGSCWPWGFPCKSAGRRYSG